MQSGEVIRFLNKASYEGYVVELILILPFYNRSLFVLHVNSGNHF
jgi:hypothetical protein